MKQVIPPQHTGSASNTDYVITTKTAEQAKQLFSKARKNLLNVNSWEELAGGLSASFSLIDAQGNKAQRPPKPGDFFKINLPAPVNESVRGYDWVQVEKMEEDVKDADFNFTAIQVRPSKAPQGEGGTSHHFFTSDATSTFCVERNGKKVMAAVYGRNEKPNTKPAGFFNKIRNGIIGFLAAIGFNKPQWKALVKGILEKDADAITFQK